jgi:ribose transport system ATP-binding protein
VKDVSFQLFRGEILGIAGLVGAGRTELAHAIFGTSEKRSSSCRRGEVRVFGEGMKPKACGLLSERRSPRAALLAGIGLVPEDRKELGIFPAMSLADNLFISNYRPVQRGLFLSSRLLKQESEKLIKALDIRTTGWQQQMKNLSGGNQQKAILARWLNAEVQILIFDEPTRGIDVGAKEQIHTLMRKLADAGKSIIMISSELPEILSMSDRILVMHEGRLVGELSAQEATEEKILKLASERKETLQ